MMIFGAERFLEHRLVHAMGNDRFHIIHGQAEHRRAEPAREEPVLDVHDFRPRLRDGQAMARANFWDDAGRCFEDEPVSQWAVTVPAILGKHKRALAIRGLA